MPILVNGAPVLEELIKQEAARISSDLRWQTITDPAEREARLREAAEQSAIQRVVLEQAASSDPRPVDPSIIEAEVERQKRAGGCRTTFTDGALRSHTEKHLRLARLTQELTAVASRPTEEEVEQFHREHQAHFRRPDQFHASHLVVHVNEGRTEEEARRAVEAALAELEKGEAFAVVAERYSDCKGNGGDLGRFPAGYMVAEFEQALRALKPHERSRIFTTPFGFHIALLHAFEPGGEAGIDDVRAEVEQVLTAMSQHREFVRGVERLRRQATIVFAPDIMAREA